MSKKALLLLVGAVLNLPLHADFQKSDSGEFIITKDLPGITGNNVLVSPDNVYVMGFSLGEQTAAAGRTVKQWTLYPGYYSGGNLGSGVGLVVNTIVVASHPRPYYQDALQVGVPVSAQATVNFSDQLDSATLAGIQVYKLQDHLGSLGSDLIPIQATVDPLLQSVVVTPTTTWEGNTLYAVVVTSAVRSLSGYTVDEEARATYLTVLNPKQDNLLLQASNGIGSLSATAVVSGGGVSLSLPIDTVGDYAAILSSKDPLNSPLRVDPKIVAEANRKARETSPYRIPVVLREMTAFDSQGRTITRLSKAAQLTLGTHGDAAASATTSAQIQPNSLSLWTLDEEHHLWLKVPGGQVLPDGTGITASISSFGVFALLGQALESTTDVFVFPVPWRPHGPQAGNGSGQTGTIDGGITFGNLPSECKIRIFTLSGEQMRELSHSNITGTIARETWDAKTMHGEPVASGVYFWRVESGTDSKNGKLMIIR
jgi:hypothetical protein